MAKVCEGLTVLDLSRGMAGSVATMVLADAGAEVIKVEPPLGDPGRRHPAFIMWNRGKKSVVLDLKSPDGASGLQAIAEKADVAISSWSREKARAMGLNGDLLREVNPGLVTCSITGFGPVEAYSHLKGYEAIVAAKTGRFHAFDNQIAKDGPPFAAVPCGSYGAAMYALQGIIAALHVRGRTGRGQHVETSLLQGLTAYDWAWLTQQMQERGTFTPFVRGSPTPQYYVAQCGDGRWLQMANSMSHLVINFVVGIGASDLLDDPRFAAMPDIMVGEDMEELYRIWHAKMGEKPIDEWQRIFSTEVDVGSEPFLTTQQGMDHPQALHNGNIIELNDPAVGHTRQVGPLVTFTETPLEPQGPAPTLGEHTEEVLASVTTRSTKTMPVTSANPRHPLEGVTVVELASWFAAPYGPAILADMGARVIKLEPLEGDPWRGSGPMGVRTIQGKESVAVDLKKPEGQAIAHKIIKNADVFMHNFRPGVVERLGVGYQQVREINPGLIYLYAGAYGSSGPSSHRPAFHPNAGAICGGALYQAGRGMPPPPDVPLDYDEARQAASSLFRANEGNPDVTSAVSVATAMMMGLHAREQTGKGQYLETSMLCANLYVNSDDCLQYEGKPDRLLPDPELNGLHALYRSYKAKDEWVFLASVTDAEWGAFCRSVGREELLSDPRFETREQRLANDEALAREIETVFPARTALEWEHLLSAQGIGCAEVRPTPFQEFANHDGPMKDSGMWLPVQHPLFGDYWRYGPGVTFSDTDCRLGPTAFIGQHTQSILAELGYGEEEVESLRSARVVTWQSEG